MKTLHNNTTENTVLNIRAQVRSGLIVLGIVTTIICSLILFRDIHSSERAEANSPTFMQVSRITPGDLTMKVKNLRIVSAIWPLR